MRSPSMSVGSAMRHAACYTPSYQLPHASSVPDAHVPGKLLLAFNNSTEEPFD